MKKIRFYRLMAAGFLLFGAACSRKAGAPSLPSAPAPSPAILWNSAYVTGSSWSGGTAWTSSFSAGVTLSVNGLAESTDTVTLAGAGGSVPLTYAGPVTVSGSPMALYRYAWSYAGDGVPQFTPPIAYQPGQPYSLTTVTSAGTAGVTAVAPGQVGFGAGSVTWTYEGNNDQVAVYNSASTVFSTTGDANSPVSVSSPFSIFDTLSVTVQQVVTSIPGAAPGSVFTISQVSSYFPY